MVSFLLTYHISDQSFVFILYKTLCNNLYLLVLNASFDDILYVCVCYHSYYLATSADDSSVKLWDLRKLKNFRTINLEEGYEVY